MLDYDRGFLLVDDADNLGDELFGICAEQPQFILVNACENSRCRAAGQCRAFGNFPDKVIIGKMLLLSNCYQKAKRNPGKPLK